MLKSLNRIAADKAIEFIKNNYDAPYGDEIHKKLRIIEGYIQSQDKLLDYYRGKIEGIEYALAMITEDEQEEE